MTSATPVLSGWDLWRLEPAGLPCQALDARADDTGGPMRLNGPTFDPVSPGQSPGEFALALLEGAGRAVRAD